MRHTYPQLFFITSFLLSFAVVSGCATATKEEPPAPTESKPEPVATPTPIVTPVPVALPKEPVTPAKRTTMYTVKRGDNLWNIAAQPTMYRNALQWPLIYKSNIGTINDADLIFPGQRLSIDLQPSAAEVSAAIQHANTRGPWRLGVVEDSDKAYLRK